MGEPRVHRSMHKLNSHRPPTRESQF
uniref:Uncharacterized protein n=1 Tax=Nymphaea colorata TaxID=210225 RepID=A0A5K1CLH8_9MAGN